jgi:hypothetical protein
VAAVPLASAMTFWSSFSGVAANAATLSASSNKPTRKVNEIFMAYLLEWIPMQAESRQQKIYFFEGSE